MAGSRIGMAESPTRLLSADARTVSTPSRTGWHQHAFWQLDHCAAGTFAVELTAGAVRFRTGQGILLPPGVPHEFRYPRGARFVSWKFTWEGRGLDEAVILNQQAGWPGVALALAAAPEPAAIPHLLSAAMHLAGATAAPLSSGITATVLDYLAEHPPATWSVAAIAHHLGRSPGHASTIFTRERGIALKRWLDTRRAEQAAGLLVSTDLTIAAIAHSGGFSDAFAFSRFFHRVTGESPSDFRRSKPVSSGDAGGGRARQL